MYKRGLSISKSFHTLLFGARGTGKTTFLQTYFEDEHTHWFDLLDLRIENRFRKNPASFSEALQQLPPERKYIVVDEIQKLPKLLDIVHQIIQRQPERFVFILTGSSARKLLHGGANLLAGRAFISKLFPLTYLELGSDFSLVKYLQSGGLPGLYRFSAESDMIEYLDAYALTYLKEEIWSEQLVRNLDPFRNFIEVAAQANGTIINYSRLARLAGTTSKTVAQYFEILKETHLGLLLESYHTSVRKRIISAPKFYFFDPGVKRALDNTLTVPIVPGTYAFGYAFEHFIITQIFFINEYMKKKFRLYYLATKDGAEIDLIVEKPDKKIILIEIKSTEQSENIEVTSLRRFQQSIPGSEALCLSRDTLARKSGTLLFFPWQKGIEYIFEL